ncbi:hypothetical protein ACNKU7_01965 [Microbulbifer sp. SA54]|uniref:hypothetical protein n=1 Tax=Microbulbifer sp. SA54 TaxID=3401577 RepID=UPI003AADC4B8
MGLEWSKNTGPNPFGVVVGDLTEHEIHFSDRESEDDRSVNSDVIDCLDYSISFLHKNIKHNSRFFLIEWDVVYSVLTIVVTDDAKEIDSPIAVKCQFTHIDRRFQPECFASISEWESSVKDYAENVKFWCKEHLSTSSAFSKFSLIALFTREGRAESSLL